jgi:hypothetical protein
MVDDALRWLVYTGALTGEPALRVTQSLGRFEESP